MALPSATPPVSTRRRGRSLNQPSNRNLIPVTGGFVHIRTGPGKEYDSVMIAHAGDVLHGIDAEGWNPILLDGEVRWISQKYSQAQNA